MSESLSVPSRAVHLPLERAAVWSEGLVDGDAWYMPVRYRLDPTPGYREVAVPLTTLEGGWFHPALHDDLPALAAALSRAL